MARFEKPGDNARSRKINRPSLSREALVLLGYSGDVDPAKLLFLDDESGNDWVDVLGSTASATGANRGTLYAALNHRRLDAQNDEAYVQVVGGPGGLPVGAYRARFHVVSSAGVASDLGIRVLNATDASTILAEVAKTVPTARGFVDVLFSVRAADSGDNVRIHVKKLLATANVIDVDFVSIHPVSAEAYPWGEVPPGGRVEFAYASGLVSTHTIYDAQAGGNVVESAAYTYVGGQLSTVAYTRDGVTMTETHTYTGTDLMKTTRVI